MEDLLCAALLIALSGAMLALAGSAWWMARRLFGTPILTDLVFYFVFVKMVFYYLLPAVMRAVSGFQFEVLDGVAPAEVVTIYAIELVSWGFWAIALLLILGVFSGQRRDTSEFLRLNMAESRALLVVLALGLIPGQWATVSGSDLPVVLEVFKSLAFYAGLAAGPLLMILSRQLYGSWPLTIVGLCCSAMSVLSLSTRGALVYSLMYCGFLVWFVSRSRRLRIGVAVAVGGLAAVYFALGGLLSGQIAIDPETGVTLSGGVGAEKLQRRSPLEEVEWRFGASTRLGTAFLRMYDRGDSAGGAPILNSVRGFLPRSLNPDKPHPSTLHGDDLYSQGMYLIQEAFGASGQMVEFPTGAHFYWEFGIPGIILLSLISGAYIALCAVCFSRLGAVALVLMVAVFKPWGYVDPKIWVSDIAIQLYQIILPFLVLIVIMRSVGYVTRLVRYASSGVAYARP